MKKIWIFLLGLCLLLVSCGGPPSSNGQSETPIQTESGTPAQTDPPGNTTPKPADTTLNVMSFNVLFTEESRTPAGATVGADLKVSTRGPKLNALLLGEKIDIAGFQELSKPWRDWMKKNLAENYAYVGGVTQGSSEAGYVVYREDKYTVLEHGVFWLSEGAPTTVANSWKGDLDRICTWVIFRDKATQEIFLFMDTHLDHAGSSARNNGAKLIVEQIGVLQERIQTTYGVASAPTVLVGDMNSTPDSGVYSKFTEILSDSLEASRGLSLESAYSSSPGLICYAKDADYKKDGHRIDYIFVSKNIVVQNYKMIHTASNRCPYGEYLSDHNAVIAKIVF